MGQNGKHLELHLRCLAEDRTTNVINTGKIIGAFMDSRFIFPLACTFEFVIVTYVRLTSGFKTEIWKTSWCIYLISCSVVGESSVFGYGWCMARGHFPAFLPGD